MAPVLGIDLGTTNSVVAVSDGVEVRVLADAEGHRLLPSVVSFHPDGSTLVGHRARERRLVDAANTIYSVKRLLGRPFRSPEVRAAQSRAAFVLQPGPRGDVHIDARGGPYSLVEMSAIVLGRIKQLADDALGEPCTQAVITVPANFDELQRSATMAAARVAGLDVLRIVNEPTAAALAYGQRGQRDERVVIYDLGGGTFDVTLLHLENDVFEVTGTAGDTFLGGDDVDLALAEAMSQAFLREFRIDPATDPQASERLRSAAEWLKCELSVRDEAEVQLEKLMPGPGGADLTFRFAMSRLQLEALAMPLLARTLDVCTDMLREAKRSLKDVESVLLVGGATRMPLVRRMVAHHFGKEPRTDVDPDLVVAQGAAVLGFALSGQPVRRITQAQAPEAAPAPTGLARVTTVKKAVARPTFVEEVATGPRPRRERRDQTQRTGGAVPPPQHANPALPPAPLAAAPPATVGMPAPPPIPRAPSSPPPPPEPPPILAVRSGPPPLLMDVTPRSLAIETVGGFCQVLVRRNSPVPAEESRVFTTSQDLQESVQARICQGESNVFDQNQPLGEVQLRVRPAPRGAVEIDVRFELDANGTLQVHAKDLGTGEAQSVRIQLLGGLSQTEIDTLRARQAQRMATAR